MDDVSAALHCNDQEKTIVDEENQFSLDKESQDNDYFRASIKAVLDMKIEPYAENLSVGQRQLVCIARALLRRETKLYRCARNKKEPYHPCIVLLDEACGLMENPPSKHFRATRHPSKPIGFVHEACSLEDND